MNMIQNYACRFQSFGFSVICKAIKNNRFMALIKIDNTVIYNAIFRLNDDLSIINWVEKILSSIEK